MNDEAVRISSILCQWEWSQIKLKGLLIWREEHTLKYRTVDIVAWQVIIRSIEEVGLEGKITKRMLAFMERYKCWRDYFDVHHRGSLFMRADVDKYAELCVLYLWGRILHGLRYCMVFCGKNKSFSVLRLNILRNVIKCV